MKRVAISPFCNVLLFSDNAFCVNGFYFSLALDRKYQHFLQTFVCQRNLYLSWPTEIILHSCNELYILLRLSRNSLYFLRPSKKEQNVFFPALYNFVCAGPFCYRLCHIIAPSTRKLSCYILIFNLGDMSWHWVSFTNVIQYVIEYKLFSSS